MYFYVFLIISVYLHGMLLSHGYPLKAVRCIFPSIETNSFSLQTIYRIFSISLLSLSTGRSGYLTFLRPSRYLRTYVSWEITRWRHQKNANQSITGATGNICFGKTIPYFPVFCFSPVLLRTFFSQLPYTFSFLKPKGTLHHVLSPAENH